MFMSVADTSASFCEALTCVESKLMWTLIDCVLDQKSKEPLRCVSCDILRHCIQVGELPADESANFVYQNTWFVWIWPM